MTNWLEIAHDACTHAGMKTPSIEVITTWDELYCANAIYHIDGGPYLKVFGPTARLQFEYERVALRQLDDVATIPTPRIIAQGEAEWPYLILSEIHGETAERIWDDLSRAEQLAIASELGTMIGTLHRLPTEPLADVEHQHSGWQHRITWMQGRQQQDINALPNLTTQQRDALSRFVLQDVYGWLNPHHAFTHYDLAHNHIYLARDAGCLSITGIIDWGDALLGPPEWDVAYLWFWTFSQDKEAMRACLRTLHPGGLPEGFARRCLAALIYTPSMQLLWDDYIRRGVKLDTLEADMKALFFPVDVFGE